ncbi:hypothetical protein PQU92_02730 [Asticcacaulis sp. BYS171W]|uniref:Uncharacterized protein n=1 Tax=Asticcacaulis aquaticus TaxID=2984212 RepID=A0ABT5HQ24_9CAUL|nr:hypothetical protein [Asticcacaulis aquaticus]MDC7682173.1 hypothetical protein [Asticcacaulis aquaticus]
MTELFECCGQVVALSRIVVIAPVRDSTDGDNPHLIFHVDIRGLDAGLWFQSVDPSAEAHQFLRRERDRLIEAWTIFCLGQVYDVGVLKVGLPAITAITPVYSQSALIGGWGGVSRHLPRYDIHVSGLKEPIRRTASLVMSDAALRDEREAVLLAWANNFQPILRKQAG